MKEKLAMHCTQEQWEQEIKPRIEKIEGVKIYNLSSNWDMFKYLTNCYGSENTISNVGYDYCKKLTIIPYDPDLFCASLGEEQPKWMPRTRGGYEYKIYEEFEGKLFGRIKIKNYWYSERWINGIGSSFLESNLIPYNPKQEAIKQEIAIKEKELEELKAKLI